MKSSFFMLAIVFFGFSSVGAAQQLGNADYPAKALREHREGITGFKVTVGADGKAKDCQITASSGSQDLDEATCKLMTTRARFRPDVNSNGDPVEGSFESRITWKLPR